MNRIEDGFASPHYAREELPDLLPQGRDLCGLPRSLLSALRGQFP